MNSELDVTSWLGEQGLKEHAPTFVENGVDLDLLTDLTNEDLKDLGVTRLADRKRLLRAIGQLSELPPSDSRASTPEVSAEIPLQSERRQVTILFADLSGFTELSTKLDAEDLHDLLTRYYQLVDGIIERFGGTVDKHIGDGVMSLFGAPVAHGNDPLRAVQAAFEIHNGMAALAAETSQPLSVHIGIASGAVIAGGLGSDGHNEYTVIGDSVNLASRLDGVAKSGETIIDGEVQRAVADTVDCRSVGEVQIKGLDVPVRVWRALALSSSESGHRRTKFVGRRSEIRQFRSALTYCQEDGTGQIVLVRGEPGIGKSRLLAEFFRESQALDFQVHRALVLDFGAGTGQDAIRTLVRSILGAKSTDAKDVSAAIDVAISAGWIEANQNGFLREYLELAQPNDGRASNEIPDATERLVETQRLLFNLLNNAAKSRAIALFVEDAHWADQAVLRQLATIAASVRELPIMLVMTTRIDGDPTNSTWRKSTLGSQILTIDLGPLRDADALELAQEFAKGGSSAAQRCVERADGNPLFLEQLLRNAAESDEETVPGSIQSLVLARIDRLDPSDKEAVQAAAVIGQRFSLDTLRHLIDRPDYSVANLIGHELIRPEGHEYLFTHALIRDSVYSSLLKKRLRNLHLKAADFFANSDHVLRAEHLDRAGDPAAASAYHAAAQTQAGSYQYEKAISLLDRGLELASESADKISLTNTKGKFLYDSGQVEQSIQTYRDLIELSVTDNEKCQAWLGMAAAMRLADRYEEAFGFLAKADVVARKSNSVRELAQIHGQRGSLYFAMGQTDECAAEQEISLKYAKQAGSTELEATALSGVADARYVAGRMVTALEYFDRSTQVAASGGFRATESVNHAMAGICQLYMLEFEKAKNEGIRAVEIADEAGLPRSKMLGEIAGYMANLEMGEVEVAQEHSNRALEISRQLGAPRFEAQSLAFAGKLAWAAGEGAQAIKLLQGAVEISARVGHGFTGPRIMGVLALCLNTPQARRDALEKGEKLLAAGAVAHNHLEFYPDAINVSLQLGDWTNAKRFASAFENFTRQEPLPWANFIVARGRTLAAWGENQRDKIIVERLRELQNRAKSAKMEFLLPAINAALKDV